MSAAAPRTIQATPDMRQLSFALVALVLAVALLVAVTISQRSATQPTSAAAGSAPVAHDHGWSSASSESAPVLFDRGWATAPNSNAIDAGRHTSLDPARGLVVTGNGGGILYTGIPYAAPDKGGTGGSNGTRFAQ